MRLIVDTNRVIAALIRDSLSRRIIPHLPVEFMTITILEQEVQKHKAVILQKANLTPAEFEIIFEKLKEKMVMIDDAMVMTKIKEARQIMDKIDHDDTPFIAAALATHADIWSDDSHFERQGKVKVWKTSNLLELIRKENQ